MLDGNTPAVDKVHGRDQVLIDLVRDQFPYKKIEERERDPNGPCRVLLQNCRSCKSKTVGNENIGNEEPTALLMLLYKLQG